MATKRSGVLAGVVAVAAGCAAASGQAFDLTVQPPSSVNAELCFLGTCDDDSSPVTGTFTIELDDPANPTSLTVTDFHLNLSEQIDLAISFGFLGGLDATGTGVSVDYDGVLAGVTAPIGAGGAFTLSSVPVLSNGTLSYTSSGLVCSGLSGAGQLCTDMIDLATLGQQIADSLTGTLTIENGVATLSASLSVTSPVPPDTTDLGTMTISGTVTATGEVPVVVTPCPCDFDGSTVQDLNDYFAYLGAFLMQLDIGNPQPGTADFDGSGAVDLNDYFAFLGCLPNLAGQTPCP